MKSLKKVNNISTQTSKKAKADVGQLVLPCLRGRIGDWMYYSTLLPFKEIANRISMADEIHKNKKLSHWIQREIGDRIPEIVRYIQEQEQRFFNSIIVGIYGGKPAWQGLAIDMKALKLSEEESDYLDKTFGILRLTGKEEMFAIDGQHRTAAIKEAVISNPELLSEEVPVIFVAHRTDSEGEIRTRRLFSTLNRYAKPVSTSEIIALDEEDNAAILTRRLIEQYPTFTNKIAFNKNKSLSLSNKNDFTNIILLYEIITTLLTDKIFIKSISIDGFKFDNFVSRRLQEDLLLSTYDKLTHEFEKIISGLPFLRTFFDDGTVDRKASSSNLLFRPIGQIVFFNAYRIAKFHKKEKLLLNYFSDDDFNLDHPVWNKLFIDPGTKNTVVTQQVQKAAILLILEKLDIPFTSTAKDKALLVNLAIDVNSI
ncbi:DNA sulfur modification protein DndB [Hymenobacter sp. H14-R3]|uniref:DNA sulfur modification protein DndB n=1 Tax=Hymenobacter sp. H14-R3 TaxID=3046308 RepID=UPI0024BA5694|nr:DNA sulfur modification protein DndB [Hymenobacter sp. H14-R3]MDJ0364840.1 DNA sulfur modification protein DndB [Hymenobacter sp. H14-R3]